MPFTRQRGTKERDIDFRARQPCDATSGAAHDAMITFPHARGVTASAARVARTANVYAISAHMSQQSAMRLYLRQMMRKSGTPRSL